MAHEELNEYVASSEKLSREIEQLAHLISQKVRKEEREAYRRDFLSFLDATHYFIYLLKTISAGQKVVGLDYLIHSMKNRVLELLHVNSSGNLTLLADMMEHEIAPIFSSWPGIARAVFR